MAKRTYPLELILRAHGPAELVNAEQETLWASDADDDFREEFNNEFLEEEDIEDILNYLADETIISEKEFEFFANKKWEFSVETLDQDEPIDGPGDEDDDSDDGED
jgi:hypothetical protein